MTNFIRIKALEQDMINSLSNCLNDANRIIEAYSENEKVLKQKIKVLKKEVRKQQKANREKNKSMQKDLEEVIDICKVAEKLKIIAGLRNDK